MARDEILAMPAGREMDALVAEKVMGWHKSDPSLDDTMWLNENDKWVHFTEGWEASSDISNAWEVVEKLKLFGLAWDADENCWRAVFWYSPDPNDVLGIAEADTAPLAICRAALLAELEA